jgi:hypothetical protein
LGLALHDDLAARIGMQLMLTIMEAVRNMVAKIPRSAGCVKDWGWRLSWGAAAVIPDTMEKHLR